MTTIGVNDLISTQGISGSSRGARLVIEALSSHHKVVPLRPDRMPRLKGLRALRMATWDLRDAPRHAARVGASAIVHCTNLGVGTRSVSSILLVHDLMAIDHAAMYDRNFAFYFKLMLSMSVPRADVIVTPSQHSKNRLLERWPNVKAIVAPWPATVSDSICPLENRQPRILCVSSVDKHKRLHLAVEAVHRAREQSGLDWHLELVTRPGNATSELKSSVARFDPTGRWIHEHSAVGDHTLRKLYRTSLALVVPSIDEGFCLPAVEAASQGTPVLDVGRGALPEVTGSRPAGGRPLDSDLDLLAEGMITLAQKDFWLQESRRLQDRARKFAPQTFRDTWLNLVEDHTAQPND